MANFFIKLKVLYGKWKSSRQERKFLTDSLIKEDGRISRQALTTFSNAWDNRPHYENDNTPLTIDTRKSLVDDFCIIFNEHTVTGPGEYREIKILARRHKPATHIPDPTIDVYVSKYRYEGQNTKKRKPMKKVIYDREYQFMSSISVTTVLLSSSYGGTKNMKEDIEELVRVIRRIFKWAINTRIDWRVRL